MKTTLSDAVGRIDSSQIRRAFDLAAKLKNPINLSIGQPHYPTPQPIIDEIYKAMCDGKNGYTSTQGILPLREALAEKYKRNNGFNISPDQILISSGVSSLLQLLFMTLINPNDRVLLLDPYFLMYKSMLDFFQAKIDYIPENFTQEDISKVKSDGLKMILYSSPSNPSGYILTEDQIRMLANLADLSGALLVSDEIYELFDYDKSFKSAASIYPQAVTLSGFSKTYSMTGHRLASVAGDKPLIDALVKLQQYTVVCAPAPVQWGGVKALTLDMSEYVEMYRKNRNYCVSQLNGKLNFSMPSGAFYIFPEIPGSDAEFIQRAVDEKELLVIPGSIFSKSHKHIRISYASSKENLERGIEALLSLLT